MQSTLRDRILALTEAREITRVEQIQPLWNNYGSLSRLHLRAASRPSVILKQIKLPVESTHPRGFTSALSRQRKIRSYQVESCWYREQNRRVDERAPTPECIGIFDEGGELCILLEDLRARGYTRSLRVASWDEITLVLSWLAHFHAQMLGVSPAGLWPQGTYWHLSTRPEELAKIQGTRLSHFASLIDARLRCGAFPTLVHGDAKLANFCFRADRSGVAAVDFQYVGRGCAMSDLAYFIGSCLGTSECQRLEPVVLDFYFSELAEALPTAVDAAALERAWRALYPVAWADFHRFMLGWNPQHQKLTSYSEEITERALRQISEELLSAAKAASLAAGQFIRAHQRQPLEIASKGFTSPAADVVTEIDLRAQEIIFEQLRPTIERYDLGWLAEEGAQDESRLTKHAFWAVDPLDGTQSFIEGTDGYATSIALVSRSGQPILGVVYVPASQQLFQATAGGGVRLNDAPLPALKERGSGVMKWFADQSLKRHPRFSTYQRTFEIRFMGGAVVNLLQLLVEPNSCYCKAPKAALGGCAIWDLAAVALMLQERGGEMSFYDGSLLDLNRPESIFFNDVGLAFASPDLTLQALRERIDAPAQGTP